MNPHIREFLQYLIYPLTLAVLGFVVNSHLDDTKKTEVMEKFIPRLTGNAPADSFLADRLIDKLLDKKSAQEIHRITRETWKARLERAVADGKKDEARLIAETANVYGGELGKEILKETQSATASVLTQYEQASESSNATGKLDPSKTLEPSQAPRQVLAAAAIIPEIQEANSKSDTAQLAPKQVYSWIYLGATKANGVWINKNINESIAPDQGKNQVVTAKTDIFRRSQLPKVVDGEWRLGSISGVLPENDRVSVQDIQFVPGVNDTKLWWAWVRPQ